MDEEVSLALPAKLVESIDEAVASGLTPDRDEFLSRAILRELHRARAERDAAILRAVGADDELDSLVEWSTNIELD